MRHKIRKKEEKKIADQCYQQHKLYYLTNTKKKIATIFVRGLWGCLKYPNYEFKFENTTTYRLF